MKMVEMKKTHNNEGKQILSNTFCSSASRFSSGRGTCGTLVKRPQRQIKHNIFLKAQKKKNQENFNLLCF